jgi:hypothetical protein
MSIKNFIDYTHQGDGVNSREALYAAIHDRVAEAINGKKIDIAQNLVGQNEEVEELDELDKETYQSYIDKRHDQAKKMKGYPMVADMSKDDLKKTGKWGDNSQLARKKIREKTPIVNPKVHDLSMMSHGDAYDTTQTSDKIKDGDVLKVKGGGTAVMIQAWPTMIHGKMNTTFHQISKPHTIHTLDKGIYAASGKKADEVHGVKSTSESVNEAREDSPIKGTVKKASYEQGAHKVEVRYSPDWDDYQVHSYKNGKHMGEGPVSYHGSDKEDAHQTAKSALAHLCKKD